MSSLIYPATLPGLTYDTTRTPNFKTNIQQALSGKETRVAMQQYPTYSFELIYSWLDDSIAASHLKSLKGLFLACQGQFDTFLYNDPTFNSVTSYQFGTGDGATQDFQLTATYQNTGGPGIAEIIQNFNGAPQIYKGGVLQTITTQYTLGSTGVVHFVAAPLNGVVLQWTGSFYYRCRFSADSLPFNYIANQWWELQKVDFQSIKL